MATLRVLIIPTYDKRYISLHDFSVYGEDEVLTEESLDVTVPGFGTKTIPFVPGTVNAFGATDLEVHITDTALPDGIWCYTYNVTVDGVPNSLSLTTIRNNILLEKFDKAYIKLDIMKCDGKMRTQSSLYLNRIWMLMQGSVAAANNCAEDSALKMYKRAEAMVDRFVSNNCGCNGNDLILYP